VRKCGSWDCRKLLLEGGRVFFVDIVAGEENSRQKGKWVGIGLVVGVDDRMGS
jgi:hypothetical protein